MSGRQIFTKAMGMGLGWNWDSNIDPQVAAQRVRLFQRAGGVGKDENLPELSPQSALQLAREQLQAIQDRMSGHYSGMPQAGTMDPTQQAGFFDRMYADPGKPVDANLSNIDPNVRTASIAYALVRLLKGDSLAEIAPAIMGPVQSQQAENDQDYQARVQKLKIDAARAQAEYGAESDRIQTDNQNRLRAWEVQGRSLNNQYETQAKQVKDLEVAAQKADDKENYLYLKNLNEGKDKAQRIMALDLYAKRVNLDPATYSQLYAYASMPREWEQSEDSKQKKLDASSAFLARKTNLLGSEYDLKEKNIESQIAKREGDLKVAREKLQVSKDAIAVRLQIANMQDRTKNRAIDLQGPLRSARIADIYSRIKDRKPGDAVATGKDLIDAYDKDIKDNRSLRARLQAQYQIVTSKIADPKIQNDNEALTGIRAMKSRLAEQIADLDNELEMFERERDMVKGGTAVGAAASAGAVAGGQKKK